MAFSKVITKGLREALRDMASDDRLARARAMGFDGPFYHGTNRDITEFKPSYSGAVGPGVYVARNPRTTDAYAGVAKGKMLDGARAWDFRKEGVVYPLMVRAKFAPEDALDAALRQVEKKYGYGNLASDDKYAKAQAILKTQGYGGVKDRHNDFWSVFDPADIRSVFAKFDPEQLGSRNILAGAGGLATVELLRRALAAKMDGESSAA